MSMNTRTISTLTLAERILQIPINFPKQRNDVPTYYKYSNDQSVTRLQINPNKILWSEIDEEYDQNVPEYTSQKVLYHDILYKDPWNKEANFDSSYEEFDLKTKKMDGTFRNGWADPVDINQSVRETPPRPLNSILNPKLRLVNWSTKQEIVNCQQMINNCKNTYKNTCKNTCKNTYENNLNKVAEEQIDINENKRINMLCLNEIAKVCMALGIKMRFSFTGPIEFDINDRPLNPIGRTGLKGRGFLGNWGPNHAADPVVCRINPTTGLLQFVLILRTDLNEWALPGGMVEAGQTIADTRTREFAEEALGHDIDENKILEKQQELKKMFDNFEPDDILYQGVVDDPRNTDNSWMETTAILTFLTQNDANLNLNAGSDASKVKWTDYETTLRLFASHKLFVDLAVEKLLRENKIIPNENHTFSAYDAIHEPNGQMDKQV